MAESRPSDRESIDPSEIARLEALSRQGWPALETDLESVAGWTLGFSGGYTRRANSVGPLLRPRLSLERAVDVTERFYGRRGRPAVFKLQPAAQPEDLDAYLASRGYERRSETIVMMRDADSENASRTGEPDSDAVSGEVRLVEGRIDPDWFEASVSLSEVGNDRRDDYRAILEKVLTTSAASLFGRFEVAGRIRSVALGCLVEDAVSFVQVATAPELRGRRLAEKTLGEILLAGRRKGAALGLLSVEAGNSSARRLYARLGFTERYRYWYREQPAVRS